MKQKLTISLDAELLSKAEQYARSQGVSLPALIEKVLREMAGECSPSFSSMWRGKFKAAERDDFRYGALAKKYLH